MADILQEMVIRISTDLAGLKKGQTETGDLLEKTRRQAEDQGKKIEEAGKRSAAFFQNMTKAATEFLAVFTAGKGFTEFLNFIDQADQKTKVFAQNLGIASGKVQGWEGAIGALGGTASGFDSALAGLVTRINNISLTGDASIIPFFTTLGVELHKTKDGTYDAIDALTQAHDKLIHWPKAQAFTLLHDFGIGDPGLVRALTDEKVNLRELIATYEKYGATRKDLDAADARSQALSKLQWEWADVGRKLLTALTPLILKVVEILDRLADWAEAHPEIIETVFAGAAGVIVALTTALTALGGSVVLGALAAVTAGVGGLGGALSLALGAVTALGLALTMLDPNDRIGSWIDKNVPGAGWLDDLASRATGGFIGKNYKDQASSQLTLDQEAYIRSSAARHNIDPDTAVRVARSEGLGGNYAGDQGSSFGPYQLHMGGLAPGANAVGGLGDNFKKATGIDPRDPSTWKAQVDYALASAAQHGWLAFHGAAAAGIGPWAGIGAAGAAAAVGSPSTSYHNNAQSSEIHANISVHSPSADPNAVARSIKDNLPYIFGAQSAVR